MTKLKIVKEGDTPVSKSSGENVIAYLEEILAIAKEGRISNVAVVAIVDDDEIMDCWANGYKPYAIAGGMEGLKTELILQHIERR